MPTESKIPQAEWDKHKDRLYALYITDDRQLEEVVERAKVELGFFASKAQYIRQFGKGKWDFKKNFRKEEWKAVSQEVSKRKFRDKDSEVWLNNSRVPSKRLRKEISRYGLHTRNQHENEITLDADSGIVVRTPPAEAGPPINYIHIPWVHFLSLTEPYFQSIRTLSPQESRTNAPRDLALQLHDTRSAWTGVQHGSDWNSAFPNDSQETIDPLQHGTFDSSSSPHSNPGDGYDSIFPLFDNSTSTHLSSLSPYEAKSSMTIVEASIRALSFLADTSRPLTESTLQGFEDQVRTYQEDLAIGVPDPDSRTVRLGSSECLLRLMSFLVYLSSNNLRADGVREFKIPSALDTLVQWLHNSRTEWVLWAFLDLKTSTTEVFGSMVFRSAAKLGLTEIVQKLIDKGVDVNSVEGDSFERETALKLAVTHNHIEIVRLLLKAGADLKPCKGAQYIDSILWRALDGPDRIEMMQTLLKNGADVNEYENFHYSRKLKYHEGSILIYAIKIQDHAMARLLLKAGAHVNAVDEYLISPLHTAVKNEDSKMVQILIGEGADVNGMSQMASGQQPLYEPLFATPIQLASQANNTKLVQMLLDEGADPCRVVQQKTCCNDYVGNFPTALQSAVDDMNTVMVKTLLKAHADVNDRASALGPPLAIAAANADLKLVRILLRHGSHINAPAERFYKSATALQAAAKTGDLEVIKELLDNGADLNADPGPVGGRTALQAAAEEGNFELVKFFISKDADLNASPSIEMGVTCLAAAVGQGHVDLALFLLENGAYVNSLAAARSGEVTALQAALKLFIRDNHYQKVDEAKEHSHFGLVKTLINAGADLNSPCSPGRSLSTLTIAVLSGQSDLVDLLLENGLDPNQCVSYRSPLGEAVAQGDSNLVRCLINARTDVDAWYEVERNSYRTRAELRKGFSGTPLQVAAAKGYVEIAQLLLDAGANMDGVIHHRSLSVTALQYAVKRDYTHMVRFLLDKGANPNVFDQSSPLDSSPLELALMDRFKPNLEIIAALIDAGADTKPTHRHHPTRSLFHLLVAEKGGLELVHLLLESGTSVKGTYNGMTVLQAFAKRGTVAMVEALLNAGVCVNEPAGSYIKRTALQYATERGDLEMVKLLLSHGADVNAPAARKYGITALQGAMRKGSLKMVLTLLEARANINDEPAAVGGRTALEAAAEWGRLDIVHLLLNNDKEPDTIEARCKRAAKFAEDNRHTTIARDLRQHGQER